MEYLLLKLAGKGTLHYSNPFNLGGIGATGTKGAKNSQNSDLVIGIGT